MHPPRPRHHTQQERSATQVARGVAIASLSALLSLIGPSSAQAVTLAEAAAMPIGTQVTIDQALVINATKMTLTGENLIQLRDDTRAVSVFAESDGISIVDFLSGMKAGDVISFTATTQSYQGLLELTAMTGPATLVNNPTISTNIDPLPVTVPDFDDFSPTAESLESRYVELQDIELFNYYGGSPSAGELFEKHTTYVARDADGNEAEVWTRSQASVDSLNAYYGTIPAGYFDLPGIFLHAFDRDDPLPGIAGENYIMNPVVVGIPGDLNFDGFVGIADLNIVLGNWNQNVAPGDKLQGDPSGDGFVGIADLNTVLGNWNTGTPPTRAVPEPGTFVCLAGMVLAVSRGLRRARSTSRV